MTIGIKKVLVLILFVLSFILAKVSSAEEDKNILLSSATSAFDEEWLDTIISIEFINDDGKEVPIGTGFLIADGTTTILVTCRHVIKNDNKNIPKNLLYKRTDITGKDSIMYEKDLISYGFGRWIIAADEDLAIRIFGHLETVSAPKTIPIDYFLKSDYIQVGAPLLVLGFPTGLRSDFSSKPIARRGMVSRHDKEKVIIETFVFPGNSGGPVIYVPYIKYGESLQSGIINQEMLAGVISTYIPYQEAAVSSQTGRIRVVFEENSGLSEIIPAKKILDLISSKAFKKV